MSRLGMIVRMDASGLGNQTRALAYMLKPVKLMVIDSRSFKRSDGMSYQDAKQHPAWYEGFSGMQINGFPNLSQCRRFLMGLTHVLTCETFYHPSMVQLAKSRGIRTFNQINYEFCDYVRFEHILRPTKILMPSTWHLAEMKARFSTEVEHLPPPLFPEWFKEAREANMRRNGPRRFLHVVGKLAVSDRNGTLDLLEALKHTRAPFELVIRTQHPLPKDYKTDDPRVRVMTGSEVSEQEIYRDFDALILPRRYGGLCLPMNEALISALPVIMPAISPNEILPEEWLVPAHLSGRFMAKMEIDFHTTDHQALGAKLTELAEMPAEDLERWKLDAFELGSDNFSKNWLKPRYEEVMEL